MTHGTKHAPRRVPATVFGAAICALTLAGCSSGNIGESWQCPLAKGGSCDSVAAADPAVPDRQATGKPVLGEPLYRVLTGDRSRAPAKTPCDSGCGAGFDPFGWLMRLFGAAEGADRPAAENITPATADPSPENAPSSGSAVREADAAAASPALAKKKSPPVEPAAAGLPDISNHADDDVSGDVASGDDLRTGEVVARIWIAPFVDANGVYREASHVRVVLEPAGWRVP